MKLLQFMKRILKQSSSVCFSFALKKDGRKVSSFRLTKDDAFRALVCYYLVMAGESEERCNCTSIFKIT